MPKKPATGETKTDRAARLAASLRENLKRRKAQARGRTQSLAPTADTQGRNRDQPDD